MAGSPLKKARRLAAAKKLAPLDEPVVRECLTPIPWNKVELTVDQRAGVAAAILAGHPRKEIASALGVSVHTLRRLINRTTELAEAVEDAEYAELEEIRSLLLAHGRAGDTVALIFLSKAFHGLRDRDDARGKADAVAPGVLVVPGMMPLEQWTIAAAVQQAQFREVPEVEPLQEFRSSTPGIEGLTLQRAG